MKNSAFVLIMLALLMMSSCNWKLPPMKDDPRLQAQEQPHSCPLSWTTNHHRIQVETKRSLPKLVSVVVDGTLKYDECFEIPTVPIPPVVSFERTKKGFELEVLHYDGYPTLPTETTVKVFDRNDCKGLEREFFSVVSLPLEFQQAPGEQPGCGGAFSATVRLRQ